MSKSDLDQKKTRQEEELRIQRQIAFASGLFQGDVTIRTLLESLIEGVVIIDNSGTILQVNAAAEQMFGYQRKELIGKPQAVLIPERFRAVHEEHRAGYFAEPTIKPMNQHFDLSGRRWDGSEFPVEISLSYIETINGVLVMSLISDISKRKRTEEEIVRLNADLSARAAELEDANQELEAFNYTVAHDLRNPLNVISGYCQVMKELCGANIGEQCRRYIQETYDGTLRMNRLIEALLNFSRLVHVELNRDRVDLSNMTKEVVEELKGPGTAARRVDIRIADGIVANGDAILLRMVLANLLDNAWKYTATQEEAVIEFGATDIDGKPVYFVRDNGSGFNMADANKLFAPFQCLPNAEKNRGFGIGLATVQRVVRRHRGRVWAESEPGKGATFYFTLSVDEK
jgi:PAS domain S-box-containing protein